MNTSKSSRGKHTWILTVVGGLLILLGGLPEGTEALTTTRVSVDSNGAQALGGDSFAPIISGNGKFVVFGSFAGNLVSSDAFGGLTDVFIRDREAGKTTRVSVDSNGIPANGVSGGPGGGFYAVSDDGRFVVFNSHSSNLDGAGRPGIFIRDRDAETTARVSLKSNGEAGEGNVLFDKPSMTADGMAVAFSSGENDFVPGDSNGGLDIFVRDLQLGETIRVSVASDGSQGTMPLGLGPGFSMKPVISSDGRFVAFCSTFTNLVLNDTNFAWDVFVHDRQTGQTTRVSVNSLGEEGNLPSCGEGTFDDSLDISGDGRFVVFSSAATNLVPNDTNNFPDIFVHDRQTGQITRVSVSTKGIEANSPSKNPHISRDGRYVVFESPAWNLVLPEEPSVHSDIFLHDLQTGVTTRLSDAMGEQGNSSSNLPDISADGKVIVFDSRASNLVAGDTNGNADVFVHERGASAKRNPESTDLDGNGTSDLLWRNTRTGSTAIWLLNGATIASAGFPGGVPLAWQIAGIGDVNGDGKADVIWRHTTSATVAIWLMNGTTITSVGFPASVPTAWSLQAVGDLNGDDKADLIWRNSNDGNTAIWLMNGAKIAASGFLGKVPLTWQLAGAGDVDADGKADLIWRNGTSHAVAIWVMNGLTMASSGFPGNASPDLQFAGVGDVDGDGKADLIWRNTNSGDVAVWLLNGTTIASTGILDRFPSQWEISQVGDADGDGKADVIWYDTTSGAVVCWLLNGLTIASEAFPGTVSTDWNIAGRPVAPQLSITTASTLPTGTVNKSYNITLAKSGGTPSFSWTVFSGSLPPGLTLNPSTGQISGTPTTAGKFLATIRVQDSGNPSQSAQDLFSLTIDPPPSPPPTGGGGGTLTVSGAPASVEGKFESNFDTASQDNQLMGGVVAWAENTVNGSVVHSEVLGISFHLGTGGVFVLPGLTFTVTDVSNVGGGSTVWSCSGSFQGPGLSPFPGTCQGISVNTVGGTVTFSNTVLEDIVSGSPPITLNGTLTFPPF